jgi:hypothetical protein
LIFCFPSVCIYLQTTYHYYLWLSKTPPCVCTTFTYSILQC